MGTKKNLSISSFGGIFPTGLGLRVPLHIGYKGLWMGCPSRCLRGEINEGPDYEKGLGISRVSQLVRAFLGSSSKARILGMSLARSFSGELKATNHEA